MFGTTGDQFIEGIGNEVVLVAISATVIALVFIGIFVSRFRRIYDTRIHPANQLAVNATRQQLRHQVSDRFLDANAVNDDNVHVNSVHHYGLDNQCPICLIEPRFPLETNCGHLFCAQCIIIYWQHGSWRGGPIRCPVCRQQVSVLLQCFTSSERVSEEDVDERTRILHEINDFNRRYSGEPRPWIDHLRDLPTLLRHVMSEFFTVGGLMYMFRIRIVLCFVAAIMYLISPLDIIPEAVFGILGLLDDVFVVGLLAIYVTIIYRRFLSRRWQNE